MTEWRRHPTLPLEANAAGEVRYRGRILPHRPDKDGYRIATFGPRRNYRTVKIHRVVIACFEGEDPREVDHKDRDRANNAYANLEYASVSKNRRNVGVQKRSASQIRCVRFRPDRGNWQAYTTKNGRQVHLGMFATAEEAKRVAEKHYAGR